MDLGTLLVATIVAIIAPVVLKLLDNRQRINEKLQDYARQDLVAERVAVAAEQAAVAARLLVRDNARVAELAASTSAIMLERLEALQNQIDRIHTLVNSNLTEAQQRELDATRTMLTMMKEVLSLKDASGIPPTVGAIALIDSVAARIAVMTRELAYKLQQTESADQALHAAQSGQ